MFGMQPRRRGCGRHLVHGQKVVIVVTRYGVQRKPLRQLKQAPEALRSGAVPQENEMAATQPEHPVHSLLQMVRTVVYVGEYSYLHDTWEFMVWMGHASNSSARGGRGGFSPFLCSRQVKPPAPAPWKGMRR